MKEGLFPMNKKLKRLFSLFSCAVIIATLFAGCKDPVNVDGSGAAATQDYPVTVNEVTVSSKPSKPVVLGAGYADAVLAIGLETSLAAVTEDCTQNDYSTLTKIAIGDAQAIIDLGADVVIAESFDDAMKTSLSEAGITCVSIAAPTNREDFERFYTQIGSVLGGASNGYTQALNAAQNIFTSLDDLSRIIPDNGTVVTGCYIYDTEGKAITGDSLASTIMGYAGITNVFKGAKGGTYDAENLKITDPNFIFCPEGEKDKIVADANFAGLTAVKKNQVYELSPSMVEWYGRTLVTTATTMAGYAYPQLLEESKATVSMVEPGTESSATSSEAASTASSSESSSTKVLTAPEITETLQTGAQGDDVFTIQERLAQLGYLTSEYDGYFGDVTAEAIKAFQKANSIKETGTATKETVKAMFADSAISAKDSTASSKADTETSSKTESTASSKSE